MKCDKKVLTLGLVLLLFVSMFLMYGCEEAEEVVDEPEEVEDVDDEEAVETEIEIRFAHVCSVVHPYNDAAHKFKELLEDKTDGKVHVSIYPAMQLGGERDIAEGMQAGTIDINLLTIGVGAMFIPELDLLTLPFLFEDADHYEEAMYGEIGQKFLDGVDEKYGFKTLHFGANIFRVPFNAVRPIESPEDFEGVSLRTMEVPAHMDAYEALGAKPTPIAYPELYTALELGTVDGGENAIGTIFADKLYEPEPIKYVTTLPVVSNGVIFLYSLELWEELPEDVQNAIIEIMPEVVETLDESYTMLDTYGLVQMEEEGIEVNHVDDLEPFIEEVKPVWDKYLPELPDWVQELHEEITR